MATEQQYEALNSEIASVEAKLRALKPKYEVQIIHVNKNEAITYGFKLYNRRWRITCGDKPLLECPARHRVEFAEVAMKIIQTVKDSVDAFDQKVQDAIEKLRAIK